MEKKNKVAVIFGLCAAYFIGSFTKLCPSAVMPLIQEELGLSSTQVGFISGIYFFAYAAMQFFVGPLCRRFSSSWVIACGMMMASFGFVIFAGATSYAPLAIGRFLIGLGVAPIFIGLLFYCQQCYSGPQYIKVFGYLLSLGNFAALCATTPLRALLTVVDRRTIFMVISIASIVVSIYLAVISLVSNERGERVESNFLTVLGNDIATVFKRPLLRSVVLLWIVQSMMLLSYQGLWCMKWTETAFPRFERLSSFSGIVVSLGVVAAGKGGYFFKGNRSWNKSMKNAGLFAVLTVLLITVIKFLNLGITGLVLSLIFDFAYGFAAGNIIFHGGALIRENTDASKNADINGVANGFGCFSQQLAQWGSGAGIDLFGKSFQLNGAFGLTYLCLAFFFAIVVLYCNGLLKKTE